MERRRSGNVGIVGSRNTWGGGGGKEGEETGGEARPTRRPKITTDAREISRAAPAAPTSVRSSSIVDHANDTHWLTSRRSPPCRPS